MAWIFPVVGDWVYSFFFGDPVGDGTTHKGLDIATINGAADAIVAPEDLHIINSGWSDAGYGNFVMAEDADGLTIIFGHMLDRPSVEMGENVKAGDLLGYVGSTGNSSGPHLHLEVRQGGIPVDPKPFLDGANDPPDTPPLPPGTPGNPNPPGATIPGIGDLSNVSDAIKAFVTWITGINYKKLFGNVVVVLGGLLVLTIGLYALTNQAAGQVGKSNLGSNVPSAVEPESVAAEPMEAPAGAEG